ncbi:cation diffusion facilitator family transporter [Brucepastera parasyntrophica]|uniref:cation diffusion facilitator family transporter n=1 Tax=Brucepastera parasyntrophica TaxID=2880008 RepID=UPI0021089465|nr:cation diffusion facilitator family transporter [Brucepastera parasyntrophica]ULQ58858.1 cation diffusion facilitator family transporter [Brucepastera parasyntrophica]
MQKDTAPDRITLVRRAAFIALFGNLVLAAMKIATGIFANSLAVLGDGIDSSTDVAIALITLVAGAIMNQPSDRKHPWGHQRAETIATVIVAFIIMIAGFQLVKTSVTQLWNRDFQNQPEPIALIITAISIAGKFLLALSQSHYGKKANSAILRANAKNMVSDIIISASVFVGLGASMLFKLPILDPIIALLVGLWVMKNALGIFMEQNLELMDGNADDHQYQILFDAVKSVPGAKNPHRARIRKMANAWDIDLDIEVDGNLTVYKAHEIAQAVEAAIRERIPEVYDIMVHVEPAGKGEHGEQFGIASRNFMVK